MIWIQQLLKEIWATKLRSLLAILGIFWGTIAVILLLALGNGFHRASKKNIMQLTDGTLFFIPGKRQLPWHGLPQGEPVHIKADRVVNLPRELSDSGVTQKDEIGGKSKRKSGVYIRGDDHFARAFNIRDRFSHNSSDIQAAVPVLMQRSYLKSAHKRSHPFVVGTTPDFAGLRKITLTAGSRFINQLDIQDAQTVVVLGYLLKTRLFGSQPVLGRTVLINEIPFTIVGVIAPPVAHHLHTDNDYNAIIPYTTSIQIWGDQDVSYFIILPQPNRETAAVKTTLSHYLAHYYHFNPKDTTAVRLFDTTKIVQFFKWFFIGMQLFLGLCGSFTLAVGALGVTNIMTLIVTERTQEIGLRFAVGASTRHIYGAILMESLLLITIGGGLAFVTAWVVILLLQSIQLPAFLGTPFISWSAMVATLLILFILGLLAGYFPARRAARMDPAEALTSS